MDDNHKMPLTYPAIQMAGLADQERRRDFQRVWLNSPSEDREADPDSTGGAAAVT